MNGDIGTKIKNLKRAKSSNLSERKKKNSELKVRDNFVVTGSHKGGAVVILNVKK